MEQEINATQMEAFYRGEVLNFYVIWGIFV